MSTAILNTYKLLLIVALAILLAPGANAQTAPAGFQVETVVSGLNLGVAADFAPNGDIFIAQKGGAIRLVDQGVLSPTPVHTITDINDYADRGLVGFALDPNFDVNGYMYVHYTHENTPGSNFEGPKTGRVVRLTYDPITQLTVPGSELILLGTTGGDAVRPSCTDFPAGTDCIAADSSSHTSDDLEFGPDGMLYVSIGDAASFSSEDPLAHRSQDVTSLNGKILRINPANGEGLTDNPFYTGDVNDNASKVWSMGFRNPFRFSFRPANGSLYVGDVGWFSFEELNVATAGSNFGWPCREGLVANPGGYPAPGFSCDPGSSYDDPTYHYGHDPVNGGSITGGVFYTGTAYPTQYQGTYFVGDFAQGWIRSFEFDASDNLVATNDFITGAGGPVEFVTDNDGNINYISVYTGELRRIVYTGGNVAPTAVASANITSGIAPLSVFFSSNGSTDPDGDPISFSWDFGDGSPVSTDTNPAYTYTTNGTYIVTLTVTDDSGASTQDTLTVTVGNTAPTAIIAAPEDGDLYTALTNISLLGIGNDPEDGVINSDANFDWDIKLHHNTHFHVLQSLTGQNPSFLAPFHGNENIYLEVTLTVTDSGGLTGTDSVNLYLDETGTPAPFHVNTLVNPAGSIVGVPLTITSTIDNSGDPEPILVDIELFNSAGAQVAQSFYDSEVITSGSPRDFTLDFTPTAADTYRVAVGLIYEGWGGLYEWTNNALTFAVSGGGGGNTPPSIALIGANPLNLNVGDTFTEPGFTATDTEDGDITGSVVVGGDTVDTGTVGTYTITYDVTDSGGLAAPQQTRSVVVTNPGSWTPTAPNGATFFDGVDDYIDTEFWDIEEPIGFTLEARFAADSFNGDTPFIGKTDGATGTPAIDWMFGVREVSPTEGTLVYTITSGGTTETLTGGSIALGQLVHASAVYDNSNMILYIDGVEVARTAKTGLIAQDITHVVWLGNLPADPTTNAFHGVFDEIRVWNEPQSAAEIVQFQGELTQKEDGLIKDWRFNEGFGQVVIDRSNSGHHGHLGSVHGAVDTNDPAFLAGVYPAGGTFAPVNGGITVTPNPVAPGSPTTISVNVDNTGDGAGFMIVNVEVYDDTETQVFQQFVDGEGFFAGETRTFDFEFTPATEGDYRVAVGLVHLFWADVYQWINDAATINVQTGGGNNAPTITLLGDNPLNLTLGATYTDPGATASDLEDGDITGSIVVGGDTVDTGTVGTYNVTYDVTDSGGLPATQQVRSVVVTDPATSGSFVVSLDATTPSYAIAAGGTTDVVIGRLNFAGIGENIDLTHVGLELTGAEVVPSDILLVKLFDGATQVGAAVFAGASTEATSTLTQTVTIPQDGDVVLTVRADLSNIGTSQPGTPGALVKINFDADRETATRGIGQTSGQFVNHSSIVDTDVAGVRMFRSFPVIAQTSVPSNDLVAGDNTFYRFSITADATDDIGIGKVTFQMTETGGVDVTSANVFAYTDSGFSIPVPGVRADGGLLLVDRTPIASDTDIDVVAQDGAGVETALQIPAGTTRYFEIRGTATNVTGGDDSVTTTLRGDLDYDGVSIFTEVNGDTNNDFIWSGNSYGTSAHVDTDWSNGFGVIGLPSIATAPATLQSTGGAPFTLSYASAVASPNPTTSGTEVTFTADVTNTGAAGTGVVNLELYSGGSQVAQTIYEDEVFAAGETRSFDLVYTPAGEGSYSLQVGLYEQFWAGFFSWTSDAVVLTVSDGGGTGGTQIYDDSLAPGFANWGWDASFDLASTAVTPSEGSNSIETTYSQPWGGLYLNHSAFDTTGSTNLVFDVNGGATGGQALQVIALDAGNAVAGQVPISNYLPTISAGSWDTVTIPLADLSVSDQNITGFIFQGTSGAIEPTFYLDNILVN